jgi:hypothetical protein
VDFTIFRIVWDLFCKCLAMNCIEKHRSKDLLTAIKSPNSWMWNPSSSKTQAPILTVYWQNNTTKSENEYGSTKKLLKTFIFKRRKCHFFLQWWNNKLQCPATLIKSPICKLFLPNTPRFWSCQLATLTLL